MQLDPLRLAEHVHGHLGWLAAAVLVHPAVVLRRRGRRAHAAVVTATALVTAAGALGAWLYVGYRDRLKGEIFRSAPSVGLVFERKEHLAFVAIVLSWVGFAAYFGGRTAEGRSKRTLETLAVFAFAVAAGVAILVASLGTVVAVYRAF